MPEISKILRMFRIGSEIKLILENVLAKDFTYINIISISQVKFFGTFPLKKLILTFSLNILPLSLILIIFA